MPGPSYAREGFNCVAPYLVVDGAVRLIEFLVRVFDARERIKFLRPDGGVMHSEFEIADSAIELADAPGDTQARTMALHVYVPDADATYWLALEAGAAPLYEPVDRPWGDRDGGVRDCCGNTWAIATRPGLSHVPEGRRAVTPYLHVKGAEGLLGFLDLALDARREYVGMTDAGGVLYARVRIGDSAVEMGDAPEGVPAMPGSLNVWVPDSDDCYRRAVAAGATSVYGPTDKPYGDREAGVRDAWGNWWFIATRRSS